MATIIDKQGGSGNTGGTVTTGPTTPGGTSSTTTNTGGGGKDSPPPPKKKTPPKKTKTAEQLQKDAEKRAIARENALRLKSAKRYNKAAINLKYQIGPLKDAIKNEFARARDQNLADIDMMLTQQLSQLREGAIKRGAEFLTAASDNEKATGDVLESGIRNLVRERADSMSAVLEQGAGETDAMRAMLMNARNWHANASEANRAYFDTAQSINAGITDLNIDTKAALSNAHMTAEGQRESIWQDFYNKRSEAMTQLGNTYGQRAEYMEQARELGLKFGKVRNKRVSDSEKGMKKQFAAAANELGKSYEQQGLPDWIDDYEGTDRVERRQSNTNLAAAPEFQQVKKAEGATLRKWSA